MSRVTIVSSYKHTSRQHREATRSTLEDGNTLHQASPSVKPNLRVKPTLSSIKKAQCMRATMQEWPRYTLFQLSIQILFNTVLIFVLGVTVCVKQRSVLSHDVSNLSSLPLLSNSLYCLILIGHS